MDCDRVFQVLTQGPFPTGTEIDAPVERHFARCDSCHRLAEALRPAAGLLEEAVDPEESRTLPGYWGNFKERNGGSLSTKASAVRPVVRSRIVLASPPRSSKRNSLRGRAFWLGVGVGIVAAAALYGFGLVPIQ